jgi:urea transport system permease protein
MAASQAIFNVPLMQPQPTTPRLTFALLALMLLLTATQASAAQIETDDPKLDAAFALILDRDFTVKAKGIEAIADSGHPQAAALLRGLLEGHLRRHQSSNRLVFVREQGSRFALTDAVTGEDLGLETKRKAKRLPINNLMRARIEAQLARLELTDPDPGVRLRAAEAMLENPGGENQALIAERLELEDNKRVLAALNAARSLGLLESGDLQQRLAAIAELKKSLEPRVRNALARLAENDPDDQVRAAATDALVGIDQRIAFFGQLETLFFGLSLGSVLVLAAIGLAITFGVMGVINMAHGELIMLGAYTTYLLQVALPGYSGVALLLSIPTAFVFCGLVGIAIERGVIRFLYGRPLETLLATFGISLILQQAVRTLVSPQNVPVANPDWMSGFWQVNSVLSLTYNRLFILLFCLIVFALLFLLLRRTSLGLQVRAVSQNRAMARAMGVHSQRVDALTFGLGSGIAGVAGVALSQLTNVGPNLGQAYIVDSFMVVVFGGVGNLWGTLVGGLSLGIANKVLEPWAGAVLAKILVLVFIILFIQRRPRGLFPQKGRAAES